MLYDIYCPGHLREFTTTGGKYRQSLDFCGGCQKRILKTYQQGMENIFMKLTDPQTSNSPQKYDCAYAQRERFFHSKLGDCTYTPSYSVLSTQSSNSKISTQVMASLCLTVLVLFTVDSLQAVPLNSLRAPMTALKTEMWSYMFPIKMAAAIVGGVMSLAKQTLTPFGIGAGIAAGIQFFDGVIGDGSAALIGF